MTVTEADDTHPTRMHSCFLLDRSKTFCIEHPLLLNIFIINNEASSEQFKSFRLNFLALRDSLQYKTNRLKNKWEKFVVCLSGFRLRFTIQIPMNLCWKLLTVSKIYELCLLALNGFPKQLFIFHNVKNLHSVA